MGLFVLSPVAQRDVGEIWDYSAQRWVEDRADSYVRDIRAAIQAVADDPRRGHECDIREGYSQYSVGRHILFFKRFPDRVEVIRILHQSMDLQRHL